MVQLLMVWLLVVAFFRDYRGSFLGCFAIQHGWQHLWVEGDPQSALQAFRNPKLVPVYSSQQVA